MLPHLIEIGRFSLPTYGVMVALGVMAGLWVASVNSKRQGVNPDKAWNLGILAIFSAILGAKVLLIINDWSWYSAHPGDILSLSMLQAGGVFYGGLIAAIIVSVWYIRRNDLPVLRTCDAFAPGIALGHAFGRIGCFGAGCCYGRHSDLPWSVTFTNPLAQHYSGTPLGIPLHPTQLYEVIIELINFGVLMWLLRRKTFEGQVIGAYLFLYGVARFFLEFLRGDEGRGTVGAMSGTQLISIAMVIAGGVLWVMRRQPTRSVAVAR